MAVLTKSAAQQQLAAEAKWWRANFNAYVDKAGASRPAWESRPGWATRVGNNPSQADSIPEDAYNSMANQWCTTSTNVHKKSSKKVDAKTGYTIYKEADKSLSGGKNTCHFIESWSDGNKFNWHFKIIK